MSDARILSGMNEAGTLWHRGDRLTFCRVVTPRLAYHAYTLRREGDDVILEWHGVPYETLRDVSGEDEVYGWRIEGTREDGTREAWRVVRLSCGCQHQGPYEAPPEEIVPQPEISERT